MASYEDFQSQLDSLESGLAGAGDVMATFTGELDRLQTTVSKTGYDINTLEKGLSRGLRAAIDGLVFDGLTLADAFKEIRDSLANAAYNAAIKPVTSHLGEMISQGVGGLINSVLPFADGGVISQGRVMPFAKGGVVNGPTTFPMSNATGLMGEAGPEAIMPLTRGADGRLGVAAQAGQGTVSITMNIQTPDAASFQRSQSQIAASMQRAMSRGQRNA